MRNVVLAIAALGFTVTAIACGDAGSEFPEGASSGASGGAASGGTGSGGITDNGPPQEPFDPSKCAVDTLQGKLLPVELTLVFDNSSSMCFVQALNNFACGDDRSRWPATTNALGAFLRSPASEGLAVAVITYGPVDSYNPPAVATNRCDSQRYEAPTFEVDDLPSEDLASKVTSIVVDTSNPDATETQTGAAITGGAVYSRNREAALNGEKRVAILLITDGNPAGCGDDPRNQSYADKLQANAAAKDAYAQGTEVYVLNIGGDAEVLNDIAANGGTGAAINIDGTDTAAISGALDAIRGKALSCDIQVPVPDRGKADPTKLNITWTPTTGAPPELLLLSPDCKDPKGWRYDNPADPKSIRLCGAICDEVLATQTGKIDVVVGCETRSAPVN
jgi:hypothetical protein